MLSSLSLRERGMASGIQMDQETALELVKKGATLLLLDVPQFTLFGIDTQVFLQSPLLLSFPESLQYFNQNLALTLKKSLECVLFLVGITKALFLIWILDVFTRKYQMFLNVTLWLLSMDAVNFIRKMLIVLGFKWHYIWIPSRILEWCFSYLLVYIIEL